MKQEFTNNIAPDENQPAVFNGHGRRINSRSARYPSVVLEPISDFGLGEVAQLRPTKDPNDASLVIGAVRPGRYWVSVTSSTGYAAAVTTGGVDLLHEPLVLGLGGLGASIDITMRDDIASFDGIVEGAPGSAQAAGSLPNSGAFPVSPTAPFAYVYCLPQADGPEQFKEIWVSPDGRFNSPPMPPGVYRVLAFKHTQNLEYRNPEAMRPYESKGQVVHLAAGGSEHLQLQIVFDGK